MTTFFALLRRRDGTLTNYIKCHYQQFQDLISIAVDVLAALTSVHATVHDYCILSGALNCNALYNLSILISWFALLFQLAKSKGLKFLETSAKANINIDKAFTMIAEDILQKVNTKIVSESDVNSGSQRKKLKLLVRTDLPLHLCTSPRVAITLQWNALWRNW